MPLAGLVGGLITGGFNQVLNRSQKEYENNLSKDLMQYQFANFMSPQAQAASYARAGFNPALAMGPGGSGAFASPSPSFAPGVPQQIQGVDFNQALLNDALREKTDSEKGKLEQEKQGQMLENMTKLQEALARIEEALSKAGLNDQQKEVYEKQKQEIEINLKTLEARNNAELNKANSEAALNEARERYTTAQYDYQQVLNQFAPEQQRAIISEVYAHSSELRAAAADHNASALEHAANEALKRFDKETQEKLRPHLIDRANAEADYEAYKAGNEGKRYMGGRVGYELPVGDADDKWSPDLPNYNPRRNYKYRHK